MTCTKRDSKGRFAKSAPEKTNWNAVIATLLIVVAVSTWCYFIPQWVTSVQKESYDKGYSVGNDVGFHDGFKKGDEYHGWNASYSSYTPLSGLILCNTAVCRSLDERYNTRWEYSIYRNTSFKRSYL